MLVFVVESKAEVVCSYTSTENDCWIVDRQLECETRVGSSHELEYWSVCRAQGATATVFIPKPHYVRAKYIWRGTLGARSYTLTWSASIYLLLKPSHEIKNLIGYFKGPLAPIYRSKVNGTKQSIIGYHAMPREIVFEKITAIHCVWYSDTWYVAKWA